MNMKRVIFAIMLVIVASTSALATPYEKKIKEICIKYYCYGKYGYNGGLDMGDMMTLGVYGYKEAATLMLLQYTMQHDARQGGLWTKSFERELKEAESLMTEEDFYKIFLESTYGKALTVVKEQFDKKFVKDEFETQAEFEARVKKDATKEYDRLCAKLVGNMNATLNVIITPETYDAENGAYKVSVKESAKFSNEVGLTNKYEKWLTMPSNEARVYKGETITPESIRSVEWEMDDDGILVGKVEYVDGHGNIKEYASGHQGTRPLVFMYDKYRESQPLLPGHVWAATDLKNYYPEYSKKLVAFVENYNKNIASNKYYDNLNSKEYLLKPSNYSLKNANNYDEEQLQKALDKQKQLIEDDYNTTVQKMATDCRKNKPDKFIAIYADEHPDFANKLAELELDYRCYNYSYSELAFFVIDDKTPYGLKCFKKYKNLFNNTDEFYSYYADADKFNKEVAKREVIQDRYQAMSLSLMKRQGRGETLVFKGAKDAKEADVRSYANTLEELKIVDKWYNTILDLCFKIDPKMQKEYEKVGYLFGSKEAFFESYVSSSYKTDLKNAKKSK